MKNSSEKKLKTFLTIVKFVLLVFIVFGIPLIIYLNNPGIIDYFRSYEDLQNMLDNYKKASIFVYLGIQIVQVVISIIPGAAVQFAAGYAFFFWLAYLLSVIGIVVGSFFAFYIARILGSDFVHLVFGEERTKHYVERLSSKRAFIIIFILYLIPGFPKDMLTYVAGISELRFLPFIVINIVARTPALMGTLLMGSFFRDQSYTGVIIIVIIAVVLFVLGMVYRKKVIHLLDELYTKSVEK